jgi:hypothetical protein
MEDIAEVLDHKPDAKVLKASLLALFSETESIDIDLY